MVATHVDTHVHLLPSTGAEVDWDEVELTLQVAKIRGLGVLCVTEHRHASKYEELANGLFIDPRISGQLVRKGVFRSETGVLLVSGAEVAIAGGGDIGVHAEPEVLLGLSSRKGAYSASDLLKTLSETGRPFWTVAHHVYSSGKWIAALDEVCEQLDAIELPAKGAKDESKYRLLANQLGKPLISSSDAHTWVQVGAGFTRFADLQYDEVSVDTTKAAIGAGGCMPEVHPTATDLIAISGLYREYREARDKKLRS